MAEGSSLTPTILCGGQARVCTARSSVASFPTRARTAAATATARGGSGGGGGGDGGGGI